MEAIIPSATPTPGESTQAATPSGESSAVTESEGPTQTGEETPNILVAYFSHTGNTQAIANFIHEDVGGDIFQIETVDPYPDDYNECVEQAGQELKDNYRPPLATEVENMDSYDVVFHWLSNLVGNNAHGGIYVS